MFRLNYKTRGNSSVKGKPKIYFCCHEKDFPLFFDQFSEELLSLQNCSVWYKTQPHEGPDEELFLELSYMQLFVMPVTSRLLNTESSVYAEFRLALEKHIPVLPIILESGLAEDFNRKFGDLQFLDKTAQDDAAASFEEKLKKYLDSVLIGDEMAAEIRGAFSNYIFLSYRKSDRRQAQQLMKLIHKDDAFRDYAIWYDEFLTPGENFNDSIKEAIKKSCLFVMTVTPNLLTEGNYVMTVEYPLAKELKKPIIPVELIPTSKLALSKNFEGIPPCADGFFKSDLAPVLRKHLPNAHLPKKDHQHDFLIGLAYLSGIDVETDHQRAVSLITSAAKGDYPPALEKLISMYKTGEGIERDIRLAISLQRKLIKIYQKQSKKQPSKANRLTLAHALWCFGDDLFSLKEFKEAEQCYSDMLSIFKEENQYRYYGIAANLIGNVYEALGDKEKALSYFTLSLETFNLLNEKDSNPRAKKCLALNYLSLGKLHFAKRSFHKAQEYFDLSFKLGTELLKEDDSLENRRNLSNACFCLGQLFDLDENQEMTEKIYDNCRTLREDVAREDYSLQAKRDLFEIYKQIVDICDIDTEDGRKKAQECCELSIKTAKAIAETSDNFKYLYMAYKKMGDYHAAIENSKESLEYYLMEVEIRRLLTQGPDGDRELYELSQALIRVWIMNKDRDLLNESYRYLCELVKKHPSIKAYASIRDNVKSILDKNN